MTPSERVKAMLKTDTWVERMTTPELTILAKLNPDLTEIKEEWTPGRFRTIIKPECRHRYKLYQLLRSKKRVPKNRHAEEILRQTKEN